MPCCTVSGCIHVLVRQIACIVGVPMELHVAMVYMAHILWEPASLLSHRYLPFDCTSLNKTATHA